MIRVLHIIWVSYKYRLDKLFDGKSMPWYLGIISKTFVLFPVPDASPGQRLRKALEDLGPLFVKFGQLLSTRKDLLSDETADALAMLQDQVTPFDSEKAIQLIENALGAPINQLFSEFDEAPLASASIAQVHCALLHDGTEVVVKVVRPGIRRVIEKDLVILKRLAWFVSHLHPDGKRLRPLEVVDEYHHILIDELDLKKEAANTSQLRRNFIDSGLLYVPDVYWNFCRENILVMEKIDGWAVTDIQQIQAQGTDLKALAERGVEIFFRQVFTDNFFHADMHPGNIFVAKTPVDPPEYIAIDCAIIGSLSEFDQYYVARCLLAIFKRDYRTVAEIHVQSGWVSPRTRVADFESSIRSVCEPIFEKPLAEISFAELLLYLFQTARRFDMQVQPSLVLLQKTLLHIEGLGRQLYPDLDLWATAKPYLENWMKNRYSPKTMARQVERYLPDWLEHMPYIPDLIYENLVRNKAVKGHVKDNDLLVSAIKKQQRLNGLIAILLVVGIAVLLLKL